MPTVLTPTNPIRFVIARLRQSIAEESRFTDQDLLDLINAGYRSACARAQALPTVATVVFPAGAQTAALPLDWGETLGVFMAGRELDIIPLEHSTRGYRNTYFQVGRTLGLGLAEPGGATATVLYARVPLPLAYDDFPAWGREHDELLRFYAAWRCVLASGGAQTIRKAQALRQQFDIGVRDLRRQATLGLGSSAGAQRKHTLSEFRGAPIAG